MLNRKKSKLFLRKFGMRPQRSLIPNTFTMSNMVFGFMAIIFASKGDPVSIGVAGVLIFVASFFDFADGAAARALGVSSPIGVQLDSLADGVAYGIAPGFIAYQAYFQKLPEIGMGLNWGMLIATILPICAIYRLAKFNIVGVDRVGFKGLPSPIAGIFIASFPVLPLSKTVFFGKIDFSLPIEVFVLIYACVALLMISDIDYNKLFSDIIKKGKKAVIITIVTCILLLFYLQMWAVFICSGLYIIFGIVREIYRIITRKPKTL